MSATIFKKMCLIKDDESTISSEYIELKWNDFVLNCDIACVQSSGIDGSVISGPAKFRGGPAKGKGGPAKCRGGPAKFRGGPAKFMDPIQH